MLTSLQVLEKAIRDVIVPTFFQERRGWTTRELMRDVLPKLSPYAPSGALLRQRMAMEGLETGRSEFYEVWKEERGTLEVAPQTPASAYSPLGKYRYEADVYWEGVERPYHLHMWKDAPVGQADLEVEVATAWKERLKKEKREYRDPFLALGEPVGFRVTTPHIYEKGPGE